MARSQFFELCITAAKDLEYLLDFIADCARTAGIGHDERLDLKAAVRAILDKAMSASAQYRRDAELRACLWTEGPRFYVRLSGASIPMLTHDTPLYADLLAHVREVQSLMDDDLGPTIVLRADRADET